MTLVRICFILFFFRANLLFALDAIDFNKLSDKNIIGKQIEYFEDKAGNFPHEKIFSSEVSSPLFTKIHTNTKNFGFSNSTFWIRFAILNSTDQSTEKYLEYDFAPTDLIELYLPDKNGRYHVVERIGDILPFNERKIKSNTPVFTIPVKKGLNIYYLRIKTTSAVVMDLRIYSSPGLIKKIGTRQILYGIFYGIMLIMFFYNLFIYFIIRDIIYILYVCFIFSSAFFQFALNGLAFQYLWPNFPWLANNSVTLLLGINILTASIFSKSFLHIRNYSRSLDLIFYGIMLVTVILGGLSLFNYRLALKLETLITSFLLIIIFISGVISYKNGESSAKYFLLAWTLFFIGGILKVFHTNGLVPNNFITMSGYQIGAAWEVILLSLALADRLRATRNHTELLRAEVLANQLKQRQLLEDEIKKKTNELNEQKTKLELKKRDYEYELVIARSVQNKLIPKDVPINFAAVYRPMIEVGGDFYDFVLFDDKQKIGIFICDVLGHGVQAALTTSVIKTLLLQAGSKKENPEELLAYMDEILTKKFDFGFITMYYAIYNQETRELTGANGGHGLPVIIDQKEIRALPMYKTYPVGIRINTKSEQSINRFKNTSHILEAGSKVLFYTDGLTECTTLDEKLSFEDKMFFQVLEANKSVSCHELVKNVMEEAEKFSSSSTFKDDVCMICLEVY